MSAYHIPVLLNESINALEIKADGVYVDATFGGGGHSMKILERLGPAGKLMVMDQDAEALKNVPDDKRIIPIHSNFRFIHNYLRYNNLDNADGILADLGVSSHQFDTEERGFSFRFDSPLDMRMNSKAHTDAAEIINSYSSENLTRVFKMYGEVDNAKRVADLICDSRRKNRIMTTGDLGRAISSVLPKFSEHKYMAKIYQALRIEVNKEMDVLEKFMPMAIKSLNPGGMLVIITYHSLEDRIVKNAIRDAAFAGILEKINKKPIVPSEEEIAGNTRARSAKLRIAKKMEE